MKGSSTALCASGMCLALVVSGCASLPPQQGRTEVASLLAARGRTLPPRTDADTERWLAETLAQPLAPEAAVQIALARNPRLGAEYARLGIASAEIYAAGRLSNPRLSAAVLRSNAAGAADQVTFGLAQSFTSLLLLPARSRFAQGDFERIQQSVGAAILDLAADAESAWFRLAAAEQVSGMRQSVARAARLSAELAQRFFDAGNLSRLDLAMQQAEASQAALDALGAQADASDARAELNRLMGLAPDAAQWTLASGLPEPLDREDALPELLRLARESRLDLLAARKEVDLLADSLGSTRRYRYLGEVEVGVETERETDRSRLTGPTLSLELPFFNRGRGAVAKAEAQIAEARARQAERELAATNAVQRAQARVGNAKARAQAFRSALIPQREEIVARTQEQVNFMLQGPFALLLAKQQEYAAYQGYLEAVRDYWLARIELAREVGGQLPSSAQSSAPTPVEPSGPATPEPQPPVDPSRETHHPLHGEQP